MTRDGVAKKAKKSSAWVWRLAAGFFVLFLIWCALSLGLIFVLVGVFHFHISSAAAPALGFAVLGFMGNALHWLARRKRLPRKRAEQLAADEFFSGERPSRSPE